MGNSIKSIVISSIAAVVLLGASVVGFTNAVKQQVKDAKYADWMKSLDDNTSLREVNMPGSHDTMALYSIGDFAGQCQDLTLKDQLNLGVRFLDIRLKEKSNKLIAVHGFIDERATFESIINTMKNFLKDHSDEFIMMSVKEEADAENSNVPFDTLVKSYLDDDLFIKDTAIPSKVGDVRGKVVLLSRYKESTIGIPCYDGWADSASFTLSNDIYVQDTYKITSKEEKQEEIVKCFNETGHALKINFLSAYRTNYFPPSYAPSAANDINPWINEEINKYNDRGIVLYDFISEANMNAFFGGSV